MKQNYSKKRGWNNKPQFPDNGREGEKAEERPAGKLGRVPEKNHKNSEPERLIPLNQETNRPNLGAEAHRKKTPSPVPQHESVETGKTIGVEKALEGR